MTAALKKHLNLRYGRVKRVPLPGNSEKNKVLRFLYAQKMLSIYSQKRHVVNVDETWLPELCYNRFSWQQRGDPASMAEQVMGHRVNLITAVSSQGQVWMALTQCNTDEQVM